jgi:hypothetical protein
MNAAILQGEAAQRKRKVPFASINISKDRRKPPSPRVLEMQGQPYRLFTLLSPQGNTSATATG